MHWTWALLALRALTADASAIDQEDIQVPSDNDIGLMELDPVEVDARGLPGTTGEHRLLLVTANDNDGHTVNYDRATLMRQYFGERSSGGDLSLASIMAECSANRLRIRPSTGPGDGLLELNFEFSFNKDGFQETHLTLGEKMYERVIESGLRAGEHFDVVYMIMPDAVSFQTAGYYAEIDGFKARIQSRHALVPNKQVNEYGHLLGLSHSSRQYSPYKYGWLRRSPYQDPTCYMGHRGPWDSIGSRRCFNAPKLSQLGWYDKHIIEITPASGKIGEVFNVDLMGIDDAAKDTANGRKLIVKLNGARDPLYIMFNRKKGINNGQFLHYDNVTVTMQESRRKDSWLLDAISPEKPKWIVKDFAGMGRNLVVKFNSFTDNKDTAKISIYIEGGCGDDTAWSVGKGNNIDQIEKFCSWFATFNPSKRCNGYWSGVSSNGKTAKEACCICGGGSCADDTAWSVGKGNLEDGTEKFCSWFALKPSIRCNGRWSRESHDGRTAKEACCVCGGGGSAN